MGSIAHSRLTNTPLFRISSSFFSSREMTCNNPKECGASSAKLKKKEDAKAQKNVPATTKPAKAKPAHGKPSEAKPAEAKAPTPATKPTKAKAAALAAAPAAKK